MSEESIFRLRVAYVKHGRLRYLGHLELIHTMERVVRRAGLPYAVTQGFSPHMRIAFSSALPVGTASDCEWFDVFLTAYVPAPEALAALTASAPADLAPQRAGYVDRRADALSAALTRAGYRVALAVGPGAAIPAFARAAGLLDAVAAVGEIPYLRGKKVKRLDVARTLVSATAEPCEGGALLALDTRSSSEGALRPEVLVRAWEKALAFAAERPQADDGSLAAEALAEPLDVHPYGVFARCEITRVFQKIEGERGILVEPLPQGA